MYCSLDKIDLAAKVDGQTVAIQTDHRSRDEIEAEPELSTLFAMARVLNARGHLAEDGFVDAAVHYVLPDDAPPALREALRAVGATIERRTTNGDRRGKLEKLGQLSPQAVGTIADRAFTDLARRAATRVGSRDLAMALRMLEDQTFADPPARDDEPSYWQRVLELAALAGELLRAKYPHATGWMHSDRATVPFGFQLDGSTIMFPTNRAQRVIEDGSDESLFKLLLAAEETMREPIDGRTGRLMPSLRDRRSVELDEIVWEPVLSDSPPAELPIIVCGIDGENTFGMIRREAIDKPPDRAMDEAIANLAAEHVDIEEARAGDLEMLVISGSFYAAEKILDRDFMRGIHVRLDAELLAAAVPTRGLLIVTSAQLDASQIARFAALVADRHDEGGGRAISPTIMLISKGQIAGFVQDERAERADTAPVRADTVPETPAGTATDSDGAKKPGLLRRLLGRK
ncbi:MAG: hypothetical protein H0T89_26515 [Deltaproteobacteria bacterium]|nr:hypothetical protein [Deltaproteobacteria bacterium]MDQ3296950.1 hypothetical protein [Myxococcota bacterium]